MVDLVDVDLIGGQLRRLWPAVPSCVHVMEQFYIKLS
jgi:hypothetical protein